MTTPPAGAVEVFADVCCPFTHVGLVRFVERRDERGGPATGAGSSGGVRRLRVRAWPLELVNGRPLDAGFIAEEIDEIREQVAPDLFTGFRPEHFPASSLPAMALAAAAYEVDERTGEAMSLALRHALFEEGRDIGAPDVLAGLAADLGVDPAAASPAAVEAEWAEGRQRGVVGSPHFFTSTGGFFCPALDVRRVDGHLRITADEEGFRQFLDDALDA